MRHFSAPSASCSFLFLASASTYALLFLCMLLHMHNLTFATHTLPAISPSLCLLLHLYYYLLHLFCTLPSLPLQNILPCSATAMLFTCHLPLPSYWEMRRERREETLPCKYRHLALHVTIFHLLCISLYLILRRLRCGFAYLGSDGLWACCCFAHIPSSA